MNKELTEAEKQVLTEGRERRKKERFGESSIKNYEPCTLREASVISYWHPINKTIVFKGIGEWGYSNYQGYVWIGYWQTIDGVRIQRKDDVYMADMVHLCGYKLKE